MQRPVRSHMRCVLWGLGEKIPRLPDLASFFRFFLSWSVPDCFSDTDIDKVRKIIKKVGIVMLEDEEFGQDFIRPVKSQGVKEITGSVMVIRVKFTAQLKPPQTIPSVCYGPTAQLFWEALKWFSSSTRLQANLAPPAPGTPARPTYAHQSPS